MTVFDEPTVIYTERRGLAGTGMTEPRALQIESDLAELLARPEIETVADIPDVDVTGIADGYVLIWDASDNEWKVGVPPNNSIAVSTDSTGLETGIELLTFIGGLDGNVVGAVMEVFPIYAGTGSADTVARSDHSHTETIIGIDAGAATGILSSGTRTIVNTTTAPLASGIVYDIEAQAIIRARNNVNSGTMNLLFRVSTNPTYPQRSRNVQTVGGVPVDQIINFHTAVTGSGVGSAVVFQVQYVSGDAVDLRDHEVIVKCHPRR